MKDLSIYFSPVESEKEFEEQSLFSEILIHDENGFPDLANEGIAIIHVPEYRNYYQGELPGKIDFRNNLYGLFKGEGWNGRVYDLGDIRPGETVKDTYFALSQVVSELIKSRIIPIVIGGGQDLTMACYKGFEPLEQMINICSIDSKLDIGKPDEPVHAHGFVSHLLMERPCYLFNYANVGAQRPFISKRELDLFDNLYFDIIRLGAFTQDNRTAEPYLRNSDMVTIDFESVRSSDSDPKCYENPNGFYAEQLCQLARYSGVSDKLNCFGIFNVNPNQNDQANSLLAQLIWYFIDGAFNRFGDYPIGSRKNYTKFHVSVEEFDGDLVFYKSDKSQRWWLEVSYPAGEEGKYERHQLVPCDKGDYENAMNNHIPNLWWKTLQKLS